MRRRRRRRRRQRLRARCELVARFSWSSRCSINELLVSRVVRSRRRRRLDERVEDGIEVA